MRVENQAHRKSGGLAGGSREAAEDSFSLAVTTTFSESNLAKASRGCREAPVFRAVKSRLTVCTRSTRRVARSRCAKLRVAGNSKETIKVGDGHNAAKNGTVIIQKDTNTPDAIYWYNSHPPH